MLRALWYGRSIRAQLLIVLVAIDLFVALAAGGVTIVRAREQTRVEMAASMRLAESLVGDAVKLVQQQISAEQFLAALPAQLRSIRHVRIAVTDAAGVPVAGSTTSDDRRDDSREPAPAWFAALVASPGETHAVPVIVNGRRIGDVAITGEPGDETAEIWDNAVTLGALGLLLNAAMVGMLYVLFGRVLDPLSVLAHGLADLEHQTYSVRLAKPRTRELGALAERFNALALALEGLHAENLRLNRRLITAQDDERRRTALELHDEVGPCLFGLKANASSIVSAATNPREDLARGVADRARDILSIIEHLQIINRSMLDRLRPMALGHVPLGDILRELVQERARQQPQTAFAFTAGALKRGYGDSVDLTVYRCIQECLTNAVRHARAKNVTVAIADESGGLALTVRDDGQGMPPGQPKGYGIRGMQERVEGLGGRYVIDSAPGEGACIRIFLPLAEPADAKASGKTA
jgi:two-component system, NarL family, sensor histidine kinase UhpB